MKTKSCLHSSGRSGSVWECLHQPTIDFPISEALPSSWYWTSGYCLVINYQTELRQWIWTVCKHIQYQLSTTLNIDFHMNHQSIWRSNFSSHSWWWIEIVCQCQYINKQNQNLNKYRKYKVTLVLLVNADFNDDDINTESSDQLLIKHFRLIQ